MANVDFVVKNGLIVTDDAEINGTGSLKIPVGGNEQRPQLQSSQYGHLRYNSDINAYEGYNGETWVPFGAELNWINKTTNYTAINKDYILTDTSNGSFTITLPSSPSTNDFVVIGDGADWSVNNLTINGNGNDIEGSSNNFILDIKNAKVEFIYNGSEWQIFSNIGAKGDTGYTGSSGAQGYTGSRGNTGFVGSQGIQGIQGYTGSQGNTGAQGSIGYTGSKGDTGFSGSKGDTGFTGSKGATGDQGSVGFTGSKGDQGEQGTQGYSGSQGIQGIQGDAGYTGSRGDIGFTGSQGDTGIQGETGFTGSTGNIGFTGSQGNVGETGSQGDTGFTGSRGNVGFTGSQGIQGIQGDTGYTGSRGDIGFTGSQGATGFTGSRGDTGYSGSKGDIGFTGSQGAQGTSITIKGTVSTTNDLPSGGNTTGDGYIVEADGDLYVWDGSQWNNVGQIVGPEGPTGFTGSRGDTGYTGSKGDTGYTGSQGVQGIQGEIGYTGSRGAVGFSGSQGVQGIQGEIGYTGSRGAIGYTGSKGDTGAQGDTGYTGSRGVIGYTGSKGDTGAQGDTGFTGSRGNVGFTGSQGIQGIQGYTGSQGNQGSTGFTGSKGDTGSQGVSGYTGSKGDIGFTGSKGDTGSQGDTGFTGSKGDQGVQGIQGYTGSQGTQGIQGDQGIQGEQGIQGFTGSKGNTGAQGATGYTGSKGTTGYTGSKGDTGAQGTTGYTGSKGDTGAQGDTGYTGSRGNIGYTGSKGTTGFTGSKGDTGAQGTTGYTGSKGDTGSQGATGYTGSRGATGYTGSKGNTGAQGATGYTGSAGPSNIINATNVSDNDTVYPVFVTAAGSNQTAEVSTSNLFFNPSTGVLTSSKLDVNGDVTITDKIIHSGDTNTSIRFPADDTFTVETAGSERMRITSTGLVGIGTSSPGELVHIEKSQNALTQVKVVNASTGTAAQARISLGNSGGNFSGFGFNGVSFTTSGVFRQDGTYLYGNGDGGLTLVTGAAQPLYFATWNVERMRITSNGNVGIGTDSPSSKLDVNGDVTITDKIIHSGDTNTSIRFPANDTFTVETAGSERMRIDSNGNVGIGTNSPSSKLDVNGDVTTNNIHVGDGSAAVPALAFEADTNTGLYRRTADELNVSVGGTEYWRFNGERGNFASASTTSLTTSYTDMVTVNFTARSQSALIVADATYDGANAITYVYSYIETTLGNSNAAYGYIGTTIAEEFTTLSNSIQIHGLTVGTSYTVKLKATKSNSAATTAQCLIASIGVFN